MITIEELTRRVNPSGALEENRITMVTLPEASGTVSNVFGVMNIRVCPVSLGNRLRNCRKIILEGFRGKDRRVVILPPSSGKVAMHQVGPETYLRFRTVFG